jgi:hypothetical protein
VTTHESGMVCTCNIHVTQIIWSGNISFGSATEGIATKIVSEIESGYFIQFHERKCKPPPKLVNK